jgi:hypothetical protein
MIWCFKQGPDFGYTNDPSGATYKKPYNFLLEDWLTLQKKETKIIGPPAKCARHDITLPGNLRTNVITPGNTFQSSYLTEIQI